MTDDLERRLRAHAVPSRAITPQNRAAFTEAADEIARLRAENEALREALKPFAEACCHLHPAHPDDGETLDGFKVADFRHARQALQKGSRHE